MEKTNLNTSHLIIEKYLPHNFLSEKIILGNLLTNTETLELIISRLSIEAFYFKNHQEIYKAILKLYERKQLIDITTVISYLQDEGQLELIGGVSTLTELITQVPNSVNIDQYITLIQNKFLRRNLIKIGYQLINSSFITNISLETILHELETEIFNLTKNTEKATLLTNAELLSNVYNELKQKSNKNALLGLSSGFYNLDALTQGFQKSDLIIIAARPSMGKTAFCLNIASNVIKSTKLPVLFFSLEMSKEQLIYRLLSMETSINNTRLRAGNIKEFEWKKLNEFKKQFSKLPFFIEDTPNISTFDIKAKIKKIRSEYQNIGLIVIDYLQLMETKTKSNNRVQELSQITRNLKHIAREFNVPIIVLSQLSRNVENRVNKRPILSDLRESGSIEQDADLVLMLYRDDYYNSNSTESNITELIITKHRNGPIGLIKLLFEAEFTRFKNLN